jgi:hypothetical protein
MSTLRLGLLTSLVVAATACSLTPIQMPNNSDAAIKLGNDRGVEGDDLSNDHHGDHGVSRDSSWKKDAVVVPRLDLCCSAVGEQGIFERGVTEAGPGDGSADKIGSDSSRKADAAIPEADRAP